MQNSVAPVLLCFGQSDVRFHRRYEPDISFAAQLAEAVYELLSEPPGANHQGPVLTAGGSEAMDLLSDGRRVRNVF